MRTLRRVWCAIFGHKSKLIYHTYVRDGRRFIACCPLYRCRRCGLVYYGFGALNPEVVDLIKATLKDLPPGDFGVALDNGAYKFSRIYKSVEEKNNAI